MKKYVANMTISVIVISTVLVGVWATVSLFAGLHRTGWQFSELIRQYMIATGMIKPFHTLVDFYSHIKGIEYLICIVFFIAFPLFYRYVNEDREKIKRSA